MAAAASGPAAYEVASATFDVTAAPLAASSSASKEAASIDIVALLGGAPGLRALGEGVSDVDVALPGPWTVIVTFSNGSSKTVTVSPDAGGAGAVPLTALEIADAVSLDVRDEAGNGGVIAVP
jgi:neutral ceramidase